MNPSLQKFNWRSTNTNERKHANAPSWPKDEANSSLVRFNPRRSNPTLPRSWTIHHNLCGLFSRLGHLPTFYIQIAYNALRIRYSVLSAGYLDSFRQGERLEHVSWWRVQYQDTHITFLLIATVVGKIYMRIHIRYRDLGKWETTAMDAQNNSSDVWPPGQVLPSIVTNQIA